MRQKKEKPVDTRPVKYSFKTKDEWLNKLPAEIAVLRCKYRFFCSDMWQKAKKQPREYIKPNVSHKIRCYTNEEYVAIIILCKNMVNINMCIDKEYCQKIAERKGAYSYMKTKYKKAIKKYEKENNEQHLQGNQLHILE